TTRRSQSSAISTDTEGKKNMVPAVCKTADGTAVPGQQCGFSPKAEDAGFDDWKYLINFEPPASVVANLQTRFHNVVPVTTQTPLWHSIHHARWSDEWHQYWYDSRRHAEGRPLDGCV